MAVLQDCSVPVFFCSQRGYVTVCTSLKVQPKFVKFVVCNPCQSSPSLPILVPFIVYYYLFLINYYFQVSLNLKVILYVAKITQTP